LLKKIGSYEITRVVLSWFKNYLENRIQRVKFNESLSGFIAMKLGVPQESVLGWLFLLYTNDLTRVVAFVKLQIIRR